MSRDEAVLLAGRGTLRLLWNDRILGDKQADYALTNSSAETTKTFSEINQNVGDRNLSVLLSDEITSSMLLPDEGEGSDAEAVLYAGETYLNGASAEDFHPCVTPTGSKVNLLSLGGTV